MIMERWSGRVAVVTGASSGIGLETVKALLNNNLIVVGLARRLEKMETEIATLPEADGKFYAVRCDVTDDNDVANAFDWIGNNVGKVQVLVNNAGVFARGKLTEIDNETLRNMINVNVMGPVYCSKEALKVMQADDLEAQIININSTFGHAVDLAPGMWLNLYPASKYAVTGITETLLREVMGENIRITSISPGLVQTPMTGDVSGIPHLESEDIANAVIYVLGTPQRVHIKDIIVPPFGGL